MNVELQIIKGLLNKEAYNKYYHLIKRDESLKKHYDLLCSMHESNEGDLTLDEYVLVGKQKGLQWLDELVDVKAGHETLLELIKTHSERSFAYSLGLICMEVFEGRKQLSDVIEEYSKLEQTKEKVSDDIFVTDDLEELAKETDRESGLQWRLPSLRENLGGLTRGDFGFIFARPETGKTTFLASEVSYMAEQAESYVIWANNEEKAERVQTRIMQASLGCTTADLYFDRSGNNRKFLTKTNNLFKLYDKTPMHKRDIEFILKQFSPSLLVIDQIDKIRGFKADRDDLLLGSIYLWAREMAKQHCPIIGVCQADASAEDKRWLTMDNVAKSKTEKAAEADFMIGIGKVHTIGLENMRFINLVKNKLTGSHARIECRIEPTIARYEEID